MGQYTPAKREPSQLAAQAKERADQVFKKLAKLAPQIHAQILLTKA